MVFRLDPSEDQLQPYNLTPSEFRHLQIAGGTRAHDGFAESDAVWNRLQERGLVTPGLVHAWNLTKLGETYVRSITTAYGQ